MGRKKSTLLKERMKTYREQQRERLPNTEELEIDDKIKDLKAKIHLNEVDLKNPSFKGNMNIIRKIECMEQQIKELESKKGKIIQK